MEDKGLIFPRTQVISDMAERYQWQLITDLLGGTLSMRAAADTYIPQFENEDPAKYQTRLGRTILFGAFEESVENIVDKPFSQDIIFNGVLDVRLERMVMNADANGTAFQDIAQSLLRLAGAYGHVHVITDAPDGKFESRAEELATSPYVRIIPANKVRQWTASTLNGQDIVTRFMYEEMHVNEKGHSEVWLREWTNNEIRLYRPVTNEGSIGSGQRFILAEEPKIHTFGRIPLTTYYTRREGVLQSKPPLLNVAELNLEHWFKSCDQNNILHYARVPMLFRSGLTEEETKVPFALSAAKVASSTSETAQMHWVELVGNQIQLGFDDQERIEKRMEVLAGKVFVPRSSATRTATGERADSSRGESRVQTWIRNLESALMQIFEHAASWVRKPLPLDFAIDIFNDFVVSSNAVGDGQLIQTARIARLIDNDTYINEMKRRGILSDDVDADKVRNSILVEDGNPADELNV